MDYEKLYKEALERAKIWQDHLNECGDKDYADELNYIFPELQDEDERIRREIITFIKKRDRSGCDYDYNLWIAWLEKQGEQKVSAVEFNAKDWYVSKVDGKIYNAKFMEKPHTNQTRKLEIEKAAMSATGIIEQEEWFIKGAEWADENPSYISSEKQGEQKPVNIDIESMVSSYKQRLLSQGQGNLENNPLINMCLSAFKHGVENVLEELNLKKLEKESEISTKSVHITDIPFGAKDSELFEESITIPDGYYAHIDNDKVIIKRRGKSTLEAIKECSDCQFNYAGECKGSCTLKRNEQIHVDKIKPKFKVGDWISNGDYTWKIVEVKPLDYILQSQDGNIVDDTISHVDEQFHSFTIQDAKDGDVIVDKYNNIGIFQKCEGIYWHSYIYLGCDGELRGFNIGGSHEQTGTHPAIKEQCGLLFQKMNEAEYEWEKIYN